MEAAAGECAWPRGVAGRRAPRRVPVLGLAFKRTNSFSGGTEPPRQKLNHTAGETPLER